MFACKQNCKIFINNFILVFFTKPTLQEQLYSKLKVNKIYCNDGNNTHLLNGAIVIEVKKINTIKY